VENEGRKGTKAEEMKKYRGMVKTERCLLPLHYPKKLFRIHQK
jgi:hypothetical protein